MLALGGTNVAPWIGGRLLVGQLAHGGFIGFVGSLLPLDLFLSRWWFLRFERHAQRRLGLGIRLGASGAGDQEDGRARAQKSLRSIDCSKPLDRPRSAAQDTPNSNGYDSRCGSNDNAGWSATKTSTMTGRQMAHQRAHIGERRQCHNVGNDERSGQRPRRFVLLRPCRTDLPPVILKH